MSNVPAIALAVAAGAYVLTPSRARATAPVGRTYSGSQRLLVVRNSTASKYAPITGSASTFLDASPRTAVSQEFADEIKARARAEFNKLAGAAKTAACKKMKEQFPNDPVIQAFDCANPSFDKIYAALGAAAGVAACAATGVGAAMAALCGPVGAWISSWAGPKIQGWCDDAWSKLGGFTDDAIDAAADAGRDVWNSVF